MPIEQNTDAAVAESCAGYKLDISSIWNSVEGKVLLQVHLLAITVHFLTTVELMRLCSSKAARTHNLANRKDYCIAL